MPRECGKTSIGGPTSRLKGARRDSTERIRAHTTALVIPSSQELGTLPCPPSTLHRAVCPNIRRYWLIISPTWPVASAPDLSSLAPPSENYPSDAIVLHSSTSCQPLTPASASASLFARWSRPASLFRGTCPIWPSAQLIRVASCT